MRCFIAVPLPPATREALALQTSRLCPRLEGARFVRPQGLHLTLHFFTDLNEAEVALAVASLREGVAGTAAFDVHLGAPGVFPDARRARVLWMGLALGAGELSRLRSRIGVSLRSRGLPVEERPFTPHLTLARFSPPIPVRPDALGLSARDVPGFVADRVTLFRSDLERGGAVHSVLESVPLGGQEA